MTLRTSRLLPLVAAIAVACGAVLAAACSGQPEGDRCDTRADNNGNDDCAGDLVCTPKGSLNGSSSTDICCPADRTQATTPLCAVATAVGVDSGGPVQTDGSTGDALPGEGGSDGGTDSPAEAAPADTGATDAPAGD